jgi:RNA polymerase sigma factor (sigma-70 family)
MTALEFNYSINLASKSLKPFALKLTKDLDDAKDLLQDTMMKAFLNKDKFSDGTNLKAWLYTIMKNTFITNYQKMVKKKTFIDTTENLHYINSSAYTINNDAINSFASAEIKKAIETVEDLFRIPFMMYFNGFKYHEIAEELNIPIGTVKNRIHIARKELKEKLSLYSNLSVN